MANGGTNLAEIVEQYPEQFGTEAQRRKYPDQATPCWSHVPDGWKEIIRGVCEKVKQHDIKLSWSQIKEKFGGLRMYPSLLNQEQKEAKHSILRQIIQEAETKSDATCLFCAAPGKKMSLGGWVVTSCRECYDKEEAIRKDEEKKL